MREPSGESGLGQQSCCGPRQDSRSPQLGTHGSGQALPWRESFRKDVVHVLRLDNDDLRTDLGRFGIVTPIPVRHTSTPDTERHRCVMEDRVLVYTRIPPDEYTDSLSSSIHLALSEGGAPFEPLNQN